ncbi:bifunctional transcriptional activator/DNA repair enzyme AdaA [Legionella hackeliae]|uniref:methylated-DNA--[protein]-cysteine S-methyltransferase n=1 Tax=Legionella hackeliae TaxID=449 RepID=A0A0A8USR9_LEGHA|nr:trifunctional transcriptional activator/DNA repair protein Ada/methylated-DNA--[protein]-cysteine S-methyltransferase [Legionella hackeliae]KTD10330.1 Ada protein (O6-methylguanine-DNA methyltransferase) [Legionella hackeliae]CEK09829.1 Methylated-DNA--protein-cysteine methyltransferase [Legionella hackeliae]STX49739.1 Ada protein (O6-methylguanine-DNA methyltransferase) [Legionella hackeliae]
MFTEMMKKDYYQALLDKNTNYDGIFFVAVKTTGIFCRPSCPARKPKFEHCEFYQTAQEALLASYRPCKRCCPLSNPHQVSNTVRLLVEAVELNPTKRWKDKDFDALSIDASTARRQFKKRFGMTFVEYARARRLGLALKQIRHGDSVISAQLDAGFESTSGFRDAFSKIMGGPPSSAKKEQQVLKASWLDMPLGPMLAIANDEALHLLEFVDRRGLEREVERLRQRLNAAIIPGTTAPIISIEEELNAYFAGKLQHFKTPVWLLGSPFQKSVWEALCRIPYGETRSYREQAILLERPSAYRAVANANGANQLAIIVPCHRIINSNGDLGGYGGGLARKRWMIEHERKHKHQG